MSTQIDRAVPDTVRYYNLLNSGFVKSISQDGYQWTMTFWDDDANGYEFVRTTLYQLMQAFSDYMEQKITYAELKAERVEE